MRRKRGILFSSLVPAWLVLLVGYLLAELGKWTMYRGIEDGGELQTSCLVDLMLTRRRWIFILEGLLTCVVSFAFFFIIPDFPEDSKWLSPTEAAFIKARLQDDQGKSARERRITFRDVLNCFKDYKFFLGGLMYFGLIVPAYSYAYFAPTIIKTYGYSNIQTQVNSLLQSQCRRGC